MRWLMSTGVALLLAFSGSQGYGTSFSPSVLADLNYELTHLEKGALVEVSADGFTSLSQIAYEQLLKDVGEKSLPDMSFTLPALAKVTLSDISLKPKLTGLALKPIYGGLAIQTAIHNLILNLGRIRIENYWLSSLASECDQTQLILGNNQDVPIQASVSARLEGGQIKFGLRSFKWHIKPEQYTTQGPALCRGPFGRENQLIRAIFEMLLKRARPIFERAVKSQIQRVLPYLSEKLRDLYTARIPFEMPDFFILPATKLEFMFMPKRLTINQQKLSLELQIAVGGGDPEDPNSTVYVPALPTLAPQSSVLSLATFGLNPEVFNKLLQVIFRNGTRELEIFPILPPILQEKLNTQELAYFWPDLKLVSTDSPRVRVFAALNAAPAFHLADNNQEIAAKLPQLSLRFQIKKDGQWQDYFLMHLSLGLSSKPQLKLGALLLHLSSPLVEVSGEWPQAYVPQDPTFDQENAQALFMELLHLMISEHSPVQGKIPSLNVNQQEFLLDHLRIARPYLKVNLLKQLTLPALSAFDN